jgi:hypothetical protein
MLNPLLTNKTTAYGRATLGAKPFRHAPFRFGIEAAQRQQPENMAI